MVKKGEDSAQQYQEAERPELAENELKEVAVLRTFLPQPLSESELITLIENTMQTLMPAP